MIYVNARALLQEPAMFAFEQRSRGLLTVPVVSGLGAMVAVLVE